VKVTKPKTNTSKPTKAAMTAVPGKPKMMQTKESVTKKGKK